MASAAPPVDLLLRAHGELLRTLAGHADKHFQGLSQAGRHFRWSLSSAQRRKLEHLDVACNFLRHVTGPLVSAFIREISEAAAVQSAGAEIPKPSVFSSSLRADADVFEPGGPVLGVLADPILDLAGAAPADQRGEQIASLVPPEEVQVDMAPLAVPLQEKLTDQAEVSAEPVAKRSKTYVVVDAGDVTDVVAADPPRTVHCFSKETQKEAIRKWFQIIRGAFHKQLSGFLQSAHDNGELDETLADIKEQLYTHAAMHLSPELSNGLGEEAYELLRQLANEASAFWAIDLSRTGPAAGAPAHETVPRSASCGAPRSSPSAGSALPKTALSRTPGFGAGPRRSRKR
mmetsp:Transcript_44594/g.135205  ORF Transcript_44594/g.135205 Transcript_44594/m.135205 type:complete len:345 (-) Transcript_44594:160-1194(-)